MPAKKKTPDFEQVLSDLENLVQQMEQGDLSLEESLAAFEQGIQLTRECQSRLQQAEQKVLQLLEKNGKLEVAPFHPEDQA